MSWLWNPTGDAQGINIDRVPEENKVEDYSGRKVEKKTANKPFLAYTEYRRQQEELHNAWLKRKEEREEKIKRGEEVGPEEPDPTAEKEIGLIGLLKFIFYVVLIITLSGKFITGSFIWENEDILPALKTLWPTDQRLFSEDFLAKFDGSDPEKPIYLAIDHDVYDVSEGKKTYGPGGSYHFMAGRDAARAFATGCFGTHRTHDVRGLTEREQKGLEHWKQFFAKHKKYKKVGKVLHKPIDPSSPIPEPCMPEQPAEGQKAAKSEAPAPKKHEEL